MAEILLLLVDYLFFVFANTEKEKPKYRALLETGTLYSVMIWHQTNSIPSNYSVCICCIGENQRDVCQLRRE